MFLNSCFNHYMHKIDCPTLGAICNKTTCYMSVDLLIKKQKNINALLSEYIAINEKVINFSKIKKKCLILSNSYLANYNPGYIKFYYRFRRTIKIFPISNFIPVPFIVISLLSDINKNQSSIVNRTKFLYDTSITLSHSTWNKANIYKGKEDIEKVISLIFLSIVTGEISQVMQ